MYGVAIATAYGTSVAKTSRNLSHDENGTDVVAASLENSGPNDEVPTVTTAYTPNPTKLVLITTAFTTANYVKTRRPNMPATRSTSHATEVHKMISKFKPSVSRRVDGV
jgi:hypothetical protein